MTNYSLCTFLGIDVACAQKKRLPIAVCIRNESGGLDTLPIRKTFDKPPQGEGNVAALDSKRRKNFADQVATWIGGLSKSLNLSIRRIAIDAPSGYCRHASGRRLAEIAMDKCGISCFTTPSEDDFARKIEQCQKHLVEGGKPSRMPNANQLWMLIGFSLFQRLKEEYECIETYPQAIVRTLKCADEHKSTKIGMQAQLNKAAKVAKTSAQELKKNVYDMTYGSLHDKLDAFFSAWLASLEVEEREALGEPPNDAIWVPKITGQ